MKRTIGIILVVMAAFGISLALAGPATAGGTGGSDCPGASQISSGSAQWNNGNIVQSMIVRDSGGCANTVFVDAIVLTHENGIWRWKAKDGFVVTGGTVILTNSAGTVIRIRSLPSGDGSISDDALIGQSRATEIMTFAVNFRPTSAG